MLPITQNKKRVLTSGYENNIERFRANFPFRIRLGERPACHFWEKQHWEVLCDNGGLFDFETLDGWHIQINERCQ
jgi:hypothetical protein